MRTRKFKTRGAQLLEVAVITTLIALTAIPAVSHLGRRVQWQYCESALATLCPASPTKVTNLRGVVFGEATVEPLAWMVRRLTSALFR